MKTRRFAEGDVIDITPAADITVGRPQQIAGLVGIPQKDIDSGDKGALAISGHFVGEKVENTAISAGDIIGWDADGNPELADPGTGCYTNVEADWDFAVGVALFAAGADAEAVYFALNRFSLAAGDLGVSGLSITGGSGDFQDYVFVAPCRCAVEEVLLASDTSCSGDDASNNWELQVQNLSDAEALISSPLNTGDDSVLNTADQADALGVDQNAVLEAGDLLELQATETGTATDLSSAVLHASVRYRAVL